MSDFSTPYQVGEIVEILMGRDAGKLAVILKICNERYVSVVDGDKRKFDNPKTKNIKHIRPTGYISNEVIKSLFEDKRVSNAKLRFVIQDYISKQFSRDKEKGE